MPEKEIIERTTDKPVTYADLLSDFRRIGIRPGMSLLVHSSLSSIGWVCGGVVSVIKALEEAISPNGTLVMPAHSSDVSDPTHWENPPVPESWRDVIRSEMPPFDNGLTPTRDMGVIAESFRKQTGVTRSNHPSASFCAWGMNRDFILQDDHYEYSQNEKSPLGRLYELNGYVLLLGVNYDKNTSFHLAEYKSAYPGKITVRDGFPMMNGGKREWHEYEDILYRSDDFIQIGKDFEATGKCASGYVGNAKSRLFPQRDLVDFSVDWMNAHRA
jgi:aminoglycoside 3-N-acetyltransferase